MPPIFGIDLSVILAFVVIQAGHNPKPYYRGLNNWNRVWGIFYSIDLQGP